MAKQPTDQQPTEPSGMTARSIVNELRKTRLDQLRAQLTGIGMKPKTIEAIADGFTTGFNQAIEDLAGMNVIHVASDREVAEAGKAAQS